jgi:hypothetical protein
MSQTKNIKVKDSQSKVDSSNTRFEGKVHYEQGTEASNILFMLICKNLPIGTVVGFNSDTPGPNPPIDLKPTIVSSSPDFIVGLQCSVPANYQCTIIYYADFKQAPPPDAKITLQASYPILD